MRDSCNMSLKWIHSSLSSSMACSMIFPAINLHFLGISQDLSRCSSILPWTSPWRVGFPDARGDGSLWCLKSWFYTTPMGLCRTHKKHYNPFGVVYCVSIVSLLPIYCCENMWKPHPRWIWGSALTACEARKQWPHVVALLQEAPSRESWNRSDGRKRLRRSVFVDSPRK